MCREIGQDIVEGSNSDWIVVWNGKVKFLVLDFPCQPHMTAGLARYLISKMGKGFDEIVAGCISWQSHAAKISSFI